LKAGDDNDVLMAMSPDMSVENYAVFFNFGFSSKPPSDFGVQQFYQYFQPGVQYKITSRLYSKT